MGDINSKGIDNSIEGSSQILQKMFSGSSKNNIIVMNPEIHIHGDYRSTSTESSMNEANEKLRRELLTKDKQIEHEKRLRESEERRRHAESVRIEQLIRQEEFQMRYQSEVLSRHVELLNEYKSYWEVGMHENVFHQTDQQNQQMESNDYEGNNGLDNRNSKEGGDYFDGQGSQSKTEFNSENDSMEFWEWNGTKWVMTMETPCTHNTQQIQSANLSVLVFESSDSSDVDIPTNYTTSLNISKRKREGRKITSTSQTTSVSSREAEQMGPPELLVIDSVNSEQKKNTEFGAGNCYPWNVSISFDDHELKDYNYWKDESFSAMSKRVKYSK